MRHHRGRLDHHKYHKEFRREAVDKSEILLRLTIAASGLACLLIVMQHWYDWRLRCARSANNFFFSSSNLLSILFEFSLTMLHPYPTLVTDHFYIWNEQINNYIDYQVNDVFYLLSYCRLLYFGIRLITLSEYWSSSAHRIR